MMEESKNCYNCIHRGTVPGSAHISCKFNWKNSKLNPPEANSHGKKSGWYNFPYNFDPVWQNEICTAHTKE